MADIFSNVIPATSSHLGELHTIEQHVSPSPWTVGQFEESLRHHSAYVLEQSGKVSGFVIFSCIAGAAELINIAVTPACQGLGLGSRLLDFCLASVKGKADSLFLDVRVSNFPAISMYTNKGFVQIGERRDYYRIPHGREDALVMAYQLEFEMPGNKGD